MKKRLQSAATGLLWIAMTAFTLVILYREWQVPASATLVLNVAEVDAFVRQRHYPEKAFWERARTMGVEGAALSADTLGRLIDQGQVMHFSKVEAEKWLSAGLVAPQLALRGNSVWVKDPDLVARMRDSIRKKGFSWRSQSYGSITAVQLPEEFEPETFSIGFSPRRVREMRERGFSLIFATDDPSDAAIEMARAGSKNVRFVFLPSADALARRGEKFSRTVAARPDAWLAALGARPGLELDDEAAGRVLRAQTYRIGDSWAGLQREVIGRGTRLVLVGLSDEHDVDENLARLREVAKGLRGAGFGLTLPDPRELDFSSLMDLRYAAALFLALAGPLMAIRQGLHSLRVMRSFLRWPQASPVLEIAAAFAATASAALSLGLCAYALLAVPQWRLGLYSEHWETWTLAAPLALSAATLYSAQARAWLRSLKRPITGLGVVKAAAVAACAAFLFCPAPISVQGLPWWLSIRWREAFIGAPCLIIAFWMQWRNLDETSRSGNHAEADPRPWLLLSLVAPIGVLQTFGQAKAPYLLLMRQTAEAWLLGACLGVIGVIAVSFREYSKVRRLALAVALLGVWFAIPAHAQEGCSAGGAGEVRALHFGETGKAHTPGFEQCGYQSNYGRPPTDLGARQEPKPGEPRAQSPGPSTAWPETGQRPIAPEFRDQPARWQPRAKDPSAAPMQWMGPTRPTAPGSESAEPVKAIDLKRFKLWSGLSVPTALSPGDLKGLTPLEANVRARMDYNKRILGEGSDVVSFAPGAGEKSNGDFYVALELDIARHDGELRDAVAAISQRSGFIPDKRVRPDPINGKESSLQLWGWIPKDRISEALTLPVVRKLAIDPQPSGVQTDPGAHMLIALRFPPDEGAHAVLERVMPRLARELGIFWMGTIGIQRLASGDKALIVSARVPARRLSRLMSDADVVKVGPYPVSSTETPAPAPKRLTAVLAEAALRDYPWLVALTLLLAIPWRVRARTTHRRQ